MPHLEPPRAALRLRGKPGTLLKHLRWFVRSVLLHSVGATGESDGVHTVTERAPNPAAADTCKVQQALLSLLCLHVYILFLILASLQLFPRARQDLLQGTQTNIKRNVLYLTVCVFIIVAKLQSFPDVELALLKHLTEICIC